MNENFPIPNQDPFAQPPAGEAMMLPMPAPGAKLPFPGPTPETPALAHEAYDLGATAVTTEAAVIPVTTEEVAAPINVPAESVTANPENEVAVAAELANIETFLSDVDRTSDPNQRTRLIEDAQVRFDGDVFAQNPDLMLAAKSALIGATNSERIARDTWGMTVRPMLEQGGEEMLQGIRIVENLVNAHAGALEQVGNDPNATAAHRQSLGGIGPIDQAVTSIKGLNISESAKKKLMITAQAFGAGLAPSQTRQIRSDKLRAQIIG